MILFFIIIIIIIIILIIFVLPLYFLLQKVLSIKIFITSNLSRKTCIERFFNYSFYFPRYRYRRTLHCNLSSKNDFQYIKPDIKFKFSSCR